MKMIAILILVVGLTASYAESDAQTARLNLKFTNGTVKDVLEEIEHQTNLSFMYDNDVFKVDRQISIEAEDETLKSVVDKLISGENLKYELVNRFIVITSAKEPPANQQGKKVTGKVTDSTGSSLPGVSVVVKGTSTGIVTDNDGNYALSNIPENATLQFSFVGMKMQEIAVAGKTSFNVILAEDAIGIEEVVAIGYGTKKRKDVIGSISSISSEDINKSSAASFEAGLQGRGAGLNVMSSGGTPGAPARVLIRGTNTLSLGTDPLYIVDGMPISTQTLGLTNEGSTNMSPLSTINPNDIESIQVLKDASATSIYGSRASNGVILITTKSGKSGKGSVDFTYSTGVSELSRTPEDIGFCNSKQYFNIMDQARANSGLTPMDPATLINTWQNKNLIDTPTRSEAENRNTNWFDQIMRNGSYKDANLSMSRGDEKNKIFASLNYRNDEGVMKNNNLERFSVRLNSDMEPVKNFTAGFRLSLSYTHNNRMKDNGAGSSSGTNGNGGGFSQLNSNIMPWFPMYSENDPTGYWNAQSGFNPATSMNSKLVRDEQKTYRGLGGAYLQYDLPWVKGLSVRTEFSADIMQNNSWNYISKYLRNDLRPYVKELSQTVNNMNYNFYTNYNRSFGKHTVSVTVGTESQSYFVNYKLMEAKDVLGSYQQIGDNPLAKLAMSSVITDERYIRSYFGRANYKFNDRYLLEFSLRSDASSVFPKENQWATFKALGAGWIVSDEAFWNSATINLLKIRGSFGQTGNQNIPSDQYMTRWSNIGLYGSPNTPDGSGLAGIAVPLSWELTNNYDMGVDFGLFGNKISGSIAYFVHDINDLLLQTSIPISSGISGGNLWQNIGRMKNQGLEFEVNGMTVSKKGFKWNGSFNITLNSNKILNLTEILDRTNKGLWSGPTLTKKDGKIGAYFLPEYAGVDPVHGVEMIYEIDKVLYDKTGETVKTGRLIAATSENMRDNRILNEDKTGLPTFWGGLSNTFSYKGFDLNLLITFQGGNYLFDPTEKIGTTPQRGQYTMRSDIVGNTWTKSGDVASYPMLVWDQSFPWDNSAATNHEWVQKSTNYNNET